MPKKLTYEQVKKYIESFNYELISIEYVSSAIKLKIKCPKNHIFKMKYNDFQQGRRCPYCVGLKKLTYEQVKKYIESFNYELISIEYDNSKEKLKIKCPKNHKFLMCYNNFQQGQRCPKCSNRISKGEKEVLKYVKSLTNELILENDRTQIINPLTKCSLELDIYIPSLNKAIEFNGKFWHLKPKVIIRDKEKIKQCKEKGIDLLIIDWEKWKSNKEVSMEKIKFWLKEK